MRIKVLKNGDGTYKVRLEDKQGPSGKVYTAQAASAASVRSVAEQLLSQRAAELAQVLA